MDEFKPEDELKPDASDRRPTRPRKSSSAPKVKVPVSRQHMMMGIGILVLLLLVLGIGSALNGGDESKKPANTAGNNSAAPVTGGSEKNIDLSGSTSMSGQQNAVPATEGAATPNTSNPQTDASGSQSISMPSVSSTPTQAAPVETPPNQQRVTLPGDLNSALNNQQGQVDNAAQGAQGSSSLPTAPATVSGSGKAITPPIAREEKPRAASSQRETHPGTHKAPAASKPAVRESKPQSTVAHSAAPVSSGASKSLPSGNYTLQLSGASKAESLNAWAKKQNLSGYHVYKTSRNGQPWYVLVSGSYATPADAKRAVSSLPAEVRAQNPWVKPLSQVKKESE
nr:SPOR domain-containing protein [Pantoea cypripedii]